MDDTPTETVEVLPKLDSQVMQDFLYKSGNFFKNHAISLTLGIAIGVLITHLLDKRGKSII